MIGCCMTCTHLCLRGVSAGVKAKENCSGVQAFFSYKYCICNIFPPAKLYLPFAKGHEPAGSCAVYIRTDCMATTLACCSARTRACDRPVHRHPRPARLLGSPLPVLSALASRALPWPEERVLTTSLCVVSCKQPRDVCRREALPRYARGASFPVAVDEGAPRLGLRNRACQRVGLHHERRLRCDYATAARGQSARHITRRLTGGARWQATTKNRWRTLPPPSRSTPAVPRGTAPTAASPLTSSAEPTQTSSTTPVRAHASAARAYNRAMCDACVALCAYARCARF